MVSTEMKAKILFLTIILCLTALYFKHTESIERIKEYEKSVAKIQVYKEYQGKYNYYIPSEDFEILNKIRNYNYLVGMGNKAALISLNLVDNHN